MRYSYEFKKTCVEMYRKGTYPETPEGVFAECFKSKVRKWYRTEELLGPEALKHKNTKKNGRLMKS